MTEISSDKDLQSVNQNADEEGKVKASGERAQNVTSDVYDVGNSSSRDGEHPPPPPTPPPPPPPLPPPPSTVINVHVSGQGTIHRKRTQIELRLRLVQAIEGNQLSTVQDLLEEGIQLDCIILFNKTPLTYSIELGHFSIAKALIGAGANISAREPIANARQPLHVAVGVFDLDMLAFLVEHGADVDGRDGCGATPAMLASFAGYLPAVQLFHAHGACLNVSDLVGRTALHRAAEGQHADIVRFLLVNGAELDSRDNFGWTAIYQSIVFGHFEIIQLLTECGISVNGTDRNGRSPLAVACNRLCPPNVRVVLSTALDFHKRERKIPTTALHSVLSSEDCTHFDFSIIALLVNTGARLNVDRLTDFFCLCPNLALQRKHVLLQYLFLSGCVGQQEDVCVAASSPYVPQLHTWLEERQSLQQLCRVAIRTHLATAMQCRNISSAVDALPVPLSVRNFLNLSDFTDMYPEFVEGASAVLGSS